MYKCSVCGYVSSKWLGKCPNCGSWNSFEEIKEIKKKKGIESELKKPVTLSEAKRTRFTRIATGIKEFDRVLGGGIVNSQVILIGGDPGVGKSTLLLQISNSLANLGYKIIYASAEESMEQIALRSERLKIHSERIYILSENKIENIIEVFKEFKPDFAIIDSIQTVYSEYLESIAGNVSQVKECGNKIVEFAKKNNIPVFIVGHVTKEGSIAGPKTLEHLVDTVLYLEGENETGLRILRSSKNRFGPTDEIGLFEMTDEGLKEIKDIKYLFLTNINLTGMAKVCLLEGIRPLVVEIQSLVANSHYGVPQRNATGFDLRRLNMLIAVLEKKLNLKLGKSDIFLNVTGGLRVKDAGADLGVCMAIISSYSDFVIPWDIVFVGEVGLGGEIRNVFGIKRRIKEAENLGFKKIFIPKQKEKIESKKVELIEVKTLWETIKKLREVINYGTKKTTR